MGPREISTEELSKIIGLENRGKAKLISGLGLADVPSIHESILTFCSSEKFLTPALESPTVSAIIISPDLVDLIEDKFIGSKAIFVTPDPLESFFQTHHFLARSTNFYSEYNFPKRVSQSAKIHSSAVVEDGVVIEDDVVISPQVFIGQGTVIGSGTYIGPGAKIGTIGMEAKVISNRRQIIDHVGGVRIGNASFVGSNTVIARSLFEGATEIGSEVHLDALVHVAHNVRIGDRSVVVAGVITGGQANIGRDTFLGIGSTFRNGVTIGDRSKINMGSVVIGNVPADETYAGYYAKKKISRGASSVTLFKESKE